MNAFEQFYQNIYGERWAGLKAALIAPAQRFMRPTFGGFSEYALDAASIRAAQALPIAPGLRVLDMCAAPGGKSLILAEAMANVFLTRASLSSPSASFGELTLNELSSARRLRLKTVIESHVPAEFQKHIQVTGYDANLFGLKRAGDFDRVLLDAPCSSERHLLEADPIQNDWKESRTKQLAHRQYSLLCSAILALKKGGILVYSTCAISPAENDGVIERALQRKGDQIELDTATGDFADLEKTKYGFQIFPDQNLNHTLGAGPMFIARLIRK
jgi:16S rRNA C967 or C1407 C5-methylase (RsmB/RsmF family)